VSSRKEENQQCLIATVPFAHVHHLPQIERQAKQRLVEGHLGLAHTIVLDECPSLRAYLRPDLVEEESLALLEATRCYDYTGGGTSRPIPGPCSTLSAQRGIPPTVEHGRARAERFTGAYAHLVAAGKPLSAFVLAQLVHASRKAAAAFLEACQYQNSDKEVCQRMDRVTNRPEAEEQSAP
jgi:hypothetical protein